MSDQINKKSDLNPGKVAANAGEQKVTGNAQEVVDDEQEVADDEQELHDLEELSDEDLEAASGGTTIIVSILTIVNSCGTTGKPTYK